ncbi:mechanosensitive ion channel [Azospirillum sp. RWY-5-1]|nr:mechanosensitive ion channel [Azospirillum oleiclasticum]
MMDWTTAARAAASRGALLRLTAFLAVLLGAVMTMPATPAAQIPIPATAAPAAAAPPDPAEIGRVIRSLEDPARRTELLTQLRALQQAQAAAEPEVPAEGLGTRLLTVLSDKVDDLGEEVGTAGRTVLDAPLALWWVERQITDPTLRATWGRLLLELTMVVVAGHGARLLMTRLLRRSRAALAERPAGSTAAKLPLLLLRGVIDLLPIVAFAAAGFGALSLTDPPRAVRLSGIAFLNASIFVQVVLLASRMLLSPRTPTLRLVGVGDAQATKLLRWIRVIALTAVYGVFIVRTANALGMPDPMYETAMKLMGFIVSAMLVAMVVQFRKPVSGWLRGEVQPDGTAAKRQGRTARLLRGAGRRLADVWHVIAILYIVVNFGIWALEIEGGFDFLIRATVISAVAIGAARLAGRLIVNASTAMRAWLSDHDGRTHWFALRARRYVGPFARLLRIAVRVAAAVVVLDAWGLGVSDWLNGQIGQRITASALSILIVLALALAAWECASGLIERYLTAPGPDGEPVERSARARTLLPLLRNAFLVILVTMVMLTTLSELGLDIAPLLAGAGVIGLAIGFGSQTLVKDVITGLFILFEDTISVGDVVNVAGKGGLVEGFTIRTMRLRDFDGTVHTIPFSAVTSVSNMTKDFSFYVFDVIVALKEDPDRVVKVLEDIGRELRADPRYSSMILAPLEVFGVDALRETGVLIKARIKTKPIQQWNVGRAFNGMMKKRFDQEGIEIPYPHRTLHVANSALPLPTTGGQPAEGRWTDPPQRAVAGQQ